MAFHSGLHERKLESLLREETLLWEQLQAKSQELEIVMERSKKHGKPFDDTMKTTINAAKAIQLELVQKSVAIAEQKRIIAFRSNTFTRGIGKKTVKSLKKNGLATIDCYDHSAEFACKTVFLVGYNLKDAGPVAPIHILILGGCTSIVMVQDANDDNMESGYVFRANSVEDSRRLVQTCLSGEVAQDPSLTINRYGDVKEQLDSSDDESEEEAVAMEEVEVEGNKEDGETMKADAASATADEGQSERIDVPVEIDSSKGREETKSVTMTEYEFLSIDEKLMAHNDDATVVKESSVKKQKVEQSVAIEEKVDTSLSAGGITLDDGNVKMAESDSDMTDEEYDKQTMSM